MKTLLVSIVTCFFIFSSCSTPQYEITVMTFNIRYDNPGDGVNRWGVRTSLVNVYLDSVAPDIVGMQEVLHSQIVDILDMMPGYSYVGTGRDDNKQGGEYSPVFFKEERFILLDHSQFWLSETPDVPGSKSWDAAITRVATWAQLEDRESGDTIYIFNTHFDHIGAQARRNSAEIISEKINQIAGDSPVILTGDFNIRKSSGDYEFMSGVFNDSNGLENAESLSKKPVTGAESTFNSFNPNTEPGIIDFIFVNDNFEVNSYVVDKIMHNGVYISDHWPLVSKVAYSR